MKINRQQSKFLFVRRKELIASFGVLLSVVYLLTFSPGISGLLLSITGLACTLFIINRESLGVYLLLWGPLILGSLFRCADIEKVGTLLAYPLAFLLLFGGKSVSLSYSFRSNMKTPLIWLMITVLVLGISYLYGPMTSYSTHKLLFFLFKLSVVVIAFFYIVLNKKVDLFSIGIFAFAASAVHYASIGYRVPFMMPSSIFESAGLRLYLIQDAAIRPENNVLGFMACSSVLMVLGSIVDKKVGLIRLLETLFVVLFGALIIFSAGQRIWMIGFIVGSIVIITVSPKNRLVAQCIIGCVSTAFAGLVVLGVIQRSRFIVKIYEGLKYDEMRGVELVGRATNFDAAINRILENPIWGHGLGGYYLDGWSHPSSGAYAHNLLLELLSETGIVGTMIILIPPIFLFIIPAFRKILRSRTANGANILPLLVMWFITSMASRDLTFSASVFAIVGILWATVPKSGVHIYTDSQAMLYKGRPHRI